MAIISDRSSSYPLAPLVHILFIIVEGLKLHAGGSNAIWMSVMYPNVTTNFSKNAAISQHCGKDGCLYDVIRDMGEHIDLAATRPTDVARLLKEKAAAYGVPSIAGTTRGSGTDPAACAAVADNRGYWGPWVP
jgi:hypothetical protein